MSLFDRAVALFDAGEQAQALAVVQALLLEDRENAAAWVLAGRVLIAQTKPERALASVRQALALLPDLAQAWDVLSEARLALGEMAAAERALSRALSLDGPTFSRMDVCLRIAHDCGRPAADVIRHFAAAHEAMTQAAALPMDELLRRQPSYAALRPVVTPAQHMLLRTLFSPNHHTAAEFQNWLDAVDIKDLESGSYRLYPFLYRRLVEVAPNHPLISFIKGNYRKTFYRNNLLLHRVSRQITEMKGQGIDVLILKGAALVESITRDIGLRPMADVDLLVRKENVPAALAILGGGHAPVEGRILEHICRHRHGHTLADDYGFETDLHWSLNSTANMLDIDLESFWRASEPGFLFGVEVRFLSATDQLFHLCVHGVQWNPEPPVRWIADAMAMLREPGIAIEWERLIDVAAHMQCALLLRCALLYLIEEFEAPIPAGVLERLERVPITPLEWHLFLFQMTVPGERASYEAVTSVARDLLLRWRYRIPDCRVVLRLQADGLDPRFSDWCKRHGVDWMIHGPRFRLPKPATRDAHFQAPSTLDDSSGFGPWYGQAKEGSSDGELFKASVINLEDDALIIDARIGYTLPITKSALLAVASVPWKAMQPG
ncbi:nucleotidyltransferase family protein [Azospirillum endophyticum]